MQSFFHKIAELKVGWNDKVLTEEIFYKLCRKFKITVQRMPLKALGLYHCTKEKHYIAIDTRLSETQTVFVMFHEFAHFLMHSPATDSSESFYASETISRDEKEADAFAYCALLPLALLKTLDPEEIADIYGAGFMMERLAVYERYGI